MTTIKRQFILVVILILSAACNNSPKIVADTTKADFYVSTEGSDDWSGALADANAQGTDGPFATLERARKAVQDLKKSESKDIIVLIRAGLYKLKKTVVFGVEDSGVTENATVTYAGLS